MLSLSKTMGEIPDGSFRTVFGTAYFDGVKWWAVVNSNPIDARWLDPIQPLQGGNIVVALMNDGQGQSSALVLGGYTEQPRPSTGTVTEVLPAGEGVRVVFTGQDGVSYSSDRFVGSYNLGDVVLLDWAAGQVSIIGKVPAPAITPQAQAPAPSSERRPSGYEVLAATASDTFGVGGWGRWASSQRGGEDVYTGTQSGYTVTGSWFYGAPRAAFAGKTITKVQFRLPGRLSVGGYSSAVTVSLYAHTSQSRPGGDVARTVGPFNVSVPAGSGPMWVELPVEFGPVIAAGGGISIAGGSYAAFKSRLTDPESGKIIGDWIQQ